MSLQRIRSLMAPVFSVLLVGSVLAFGSQPGDTAAVPMASGVQPPAPYSVSTAQPELPMFSTDTEEFSLASGELPPLMGAADIAAGMSVSEEPPGEDTTVLTKPSVVPTVVIPSAAPAVKAEQTTLLAMPVKGRKTSRFGMRFHPIRKVWKLHSGLDLAAPCGTPVGAAAPGTVIRTGWAGGNGIQVKIDHGKLGGRNVVTTYNHLSAIGVRVGQSVQTHQGVGRVGTTGFSTGCHLHFEVIVNGKFSDPEPWLNGTAGAVDFAAMTSEKPAAAAPAGASSTPPGSSPAAPSPTPTPSATPSPSVTVSPSPSAKPSSSVTATPTPTPTPTVTQTPSDSPTPLPPCAAPTPGVEPPDEPTPCQSATPSPSPSETPSGPPVDDTPSASPSTTSPSSPSTSTSTSTSPSESPTAVPSPSSTPSTKSPAASPSNKDSAPATHTPSAIVTQSMTQSPTATTSSVEPPASPEESTPQE